MEVKYPQLLKMSVKMGAALQVKTWWTLEDFDYTVNAAPKDIMRFGANFFASPTGSKHLGEMKTMIKTSGHQGTTASTRLRND